MKIYTRKGDDGTTGLLFGGRTSKDSNSVALNGAVDEAQAFIGLARSFAESDDLNAVSISVERDLWILMAEVATETSKRPKLTDGVTLVTAVMVTRLESEIDRISELFEAPKEFVIPGESKVAAFFDVARTVTRRAERLSVAFVAANPESQVGSYLNRLSDLLYTLARWQEHQYLTSRSL